MDNSINQDNLNIDSVISNVKQEFKNFLIKREQFVIKLGKALENEHPNKKENICAEIKGILREEIADGLISRRDIERYSLEKWKKNTKPKKEENDKLSFSTQVKETIPHVLVDAYGNSEIEQVAISDAESNSNIVDYELSSKGENLRADACPRCKELEDVIKKSTSFTSADQQFSEQADKSFDVQFQVPFEDLRMHMSSSLSKNNAVSKVSFSANVDVVNRKLTDIQIGEHWDSTNDDSDMY